MNATLDEHPLPGRGRQGRDNRDRRRDHQCTRAGDDQQHEGAIQPFGRVRVEDQRWYHGDADGNRDHRRGVVGGKSLHKRLGRRALRLRLVEPEQVVAVAELLVGVDADVLAQLEHALLADPQPRAPDRHRQPVGHLPVPRPSAHTMASLEHDDPGASCYELPRRRQPREAGADHADVRMETFHGRSPSPAQVVLHDGTCAASAGGQ